MEKYLGNDPQYIRNKDVSKEEKNLAALIHLGLFVGILIPLAGLAVPVVIWILKKAESPFIDDQGKEAINFIINMIIIGTFVAVLCIIFVGFLLVIPLGLYILIMPIVAAVKSSDGEYYKYPFIFRFIK